MPVCKTCGSESVYDCAPDGTCFCAGRCATHGISKRREFRIVRWQKETKTVNINLLEDRLLVRVDAEEGEKTTDSGLVVPGQVDPYTVGTITHIGDGADVEADGYALEVGNTVIFPTYAGSPFDWDGETLKLLRRMDVVGIVSS